MIAPVWTVDEARAHDREATMQGVPFLSLMERAGAAVAQLVTTHEGIGRQFLILVGPGANGGDGLVAARLLARHNQVTVALLNGHPRFAGSAQLMQAAEAFGAIMTDNRGASEVLEGPLDAVIDGVLGTGYHGGWQGIPGQAVLEDVSRQKVPVYAIDILSGVDANTGEYDGPWQNVRATVTFGAPKWGHFCQVGATLTGQLTVADIGFATTSSGGQWMHPALAATFRPEISEWGHKFQKGRVVVVGGSRGMVGAPLLSGRAALKTGAGLVDVMIPQKAIGAMAAPLSLMVWPASDTPDGHLHLRTRDWERLAYADGIVVGPGMGRKAGAGMLHRLIKIGKPMVIDADGLSLLARSPHLRTAIDSRVVLTPHSGEMARLLERTPQNVEQNRPQAVKDAIALFGASILLKGPYTLSSTESHMMVNTSGGSELATAGSGDVLAGIIGALLVGGCPPYRAMALGAYLHGWAGYHAAQTQGTVTAEDIIEGIGMAWQSIKQRKWPRRAPYGDTVYDGESVSAHTNGDQFDGHPT